MRITGDNMISSMTGYANVELKTRNGTFIWDLKTVNHRFLENIFRLPDSLKGIEARVREATRQKLERGKLEAVLQFKPVVSQSGYAINEDLVRSIVTSASRIVKLTEEIAGSGSAAPIYPLTVLQMPGVMDSTADVNELMQDAITAYDTALDQLKTSRIREGEKLEKVLLDKVDAVEAEVGKIKASMPDVLSWQKEKLEKALEGFRGTLDPDRVEQEFILIAQRLDIAEEIDRLSTHVAEVRSIIKKGGSCGRKLDFMMQELNRESNTIASKSISAVITSSAVELKVLIEQMREQIQNIE